MTIGFRNTVMEKSHATNTEHMGLLLFRDCWYVSSFCLTPEGAICFAAW